VGDSLPIMNNDWLHLAEIEHRRRLRPSLRRRLERRARELGMLERQWCYEAMAKDLMLGRLDEGLIEWWEPTRGGVAGFNRQDTGT
jgi:hypothetical protein